jgi:hypothetical protein
MFYSHRSAGGENIRSFSAKPASTKPGTNEPNQVNIIFAESGLLIQPFIPACLA